MHGTNLNVKIHLFALKALKQIMQMVKSVPAVHTVPAAGPFGPAVAVWRRPTANTVNTMPDKTLKAFFDHGTLSGPLPEDGAPSLAMLEKISAAGVDLDKAAEELQVEGAKKFDDSWNSLLADIETKTAAMA